jgi:hypothetical protein
MLTNQDEISNNLGGPSNDALYKMSVYLDKRFRRRIFIEDHRWFLPNFGSFSQAVSEEKTCLNRPIRNKNCLWLPCLLMDRDNMSNLYRGPSIDTSYHVSVYLTNVLQRRGLKCEKLTDDGRQTTDDRWQTIDDVRWMTDDGWRTTDHGRQTTNDGRQVIAKAHVALGKVS